MKQIISSSFSASWKRAHFRTVIFSFRSITGYMVYRCDSIYAYEMLLHQTRSAYLKI